MCCRKQKEDTISKVQSQEEQGKPQLIKMEWREVADSSCIHRKPGNDRDRVVRSTRVFGYFIILGYMISAVLRIITWPIHISCREK